MIFAAIAFSPMLLFSPPFFPAVNSSSWPIDGTLTGAITPGQSGPGSNGNEGVLQISQSSGTGASLLDADLSHTQDTSSVFDP